MIILGIDPGTATTGFGVIDYDKKNKNQFLCIAYGTIETSPKQDVGERLKRINFDLNEIIKKYKPEWLLLKAFSFLKT